MCSARCSLISLLPPSHTALVHRACVLQGQSYLRTFALAVCLIWNALHPESCKLLQSPLERGSELYTNKAAGPGSGGWVKVQENLGTADVCWDGEVLDWGGCSLGSGWEKQYGQWTVGGGVSDCFFEHSEFKASGDFQVEMLSEWLAGVVGY